MAPQARIVLASASPRRKELLKSAGIEFVSLPAEITEVPLPGESAVLFAERMAREKARAIDRALRHLLGYQIVEYVGDEYRIKIRLLDRWLRRFRLGLTD